MNILIYLIIVLLFAVLIFWIWNNTKEFEETSERIIYIIVGIAVVAIVTLIYFAISKIGITYPKSRNDRASKKNSSIGIHTNKWIFKFATYCIIKNENKNEI